jgi:hypothetical protein
VLRPVEGVQVTVFALTVETLITVDAPEQIFATGLFFFRIGEVSCTTVA